jgi:glycosyltransferase involved in cell wall biosynthesis
MPNPEALDLVEGATAGLCLLRDLPNYRHSVPTKILEYMARGVPVITTPLPEARAIVERHGCGIVVPFDDPAAVVTAVRSLRDDDLRTRLASNGRRAAAAHFDGAVESRRFVAHCEMTASR